MLRLAITLTFGNLHPNYVCLYKFLHEDLQKKNKYDLIIIPNLTNYFSDSFSYLKNYIDKNFDEIKRIIILEGGNGPYRKTIHPIWDWGFHSFSTLLKIFEDKKFSKISKKEIKNNSTKTNGIITKFKFTVEKVNRIIPAELNQELFEIQYLLPLVDLLLEMLPQEVALQAKFGCHFMKRNTTHFNSFKHA